MQLPSLLGHVQELLSTILATHLGGASQMARGRPADSLIDTFFRARKYLGSHDRRFIAETTYGTLRHLRRSQVALQSALSTASVSPTPEDLLLLTVVSYLVGNAHAAEITPALLEPKLRDSSLKEKLPFILSQLAAENHVPAQDDAARLGVQYSYADWMVKRLIDQYGVQDAEQLMASLNEQAPITLRVNTLKASVEECQERLKAEGIETTRTKLSPVGLQLAKRVNIFSVKAFQDGLFEVQDEGSQLLPLLIDPKPTAKLLDACAGAGGKTLEFAAIMKNRGEIFAADVNDTRLDELRKRSRRAGVSNVRVKAVASLGDLSGDFTGYFDVILIDAPCSGLGTIRRNPGMKWSVTEETISEVSQKQAGILEDSAALVKPGGRLVYATCTVLREENEGVVEQFLAQHTEFVGVDVSASAEKLKIASAVKEKYLRLQPHVHGTDGFFCAALQRSIK